MHSILIDRLGCVGACVFVLEGGWHGKLLACLPDNTWADWMCKGIAVVVFVHFLVDRQSMWTLTMHLLG